jgi:signal transduction histidine kinase
MSHPAAPIDDALESAKLAALAEFAAGAGHEINNPLTVIVGRAQLLLRGEPDPERRRDLAVIIAQARRITEMIADLRLFAACPEMEHQAVDVSALVREAVESLRPDAEEQQTTLAYNSEPAATATTLSVSGDPVQLLSAVRALLQNALEAVASGGRVEVAASVAQGEVRITVSDDGPGITPEQLPHIFEPFYSARQAGRGIGMGLSKCWRIVSGHGGRIDVQSRLGAGAVFTISLPAPTRRRSLEAPHLPTTVAHKKMRASAQEDAP